MPAPHGLPILQTEVLTGAVNQFPYDPREYPLFPFFAPTGFGTDEITWDIIVGTRGMARLTTLDSAGNLITRDAQKKGRVSPGYMQEGDTFTPKELALLRSPGTPTADKAALVARSQKKLLAMVRERTHWMMVSMLNAGAISYTLDGVSSSVSYGFPTLTAANPKWSSATALMIRDMHAWIREFTNNAGYPPTHVFFNTSIFHNYVIANTEWATYVKAVPQLAAAVLQGQTAPFVVAGIPVTWVPVPGQYTNDAGSTADRWDQTILTFAALNRPDSGLKWARVFTAKNGGANQIGSWAYEHEGANKGQTEIYVADNGIPYTEDPNSIQRVVIHS